MAQGPCRLWQAAWLFLWALFPQILHALPVLEGVSIEQAPILGQPLDVRVAIDGPTEWRVAQVDPVERASSFVDMQWRLLAQDGDGLRRYAWSSAALVDEPILSLVLENAADPNERRMLMLLPEFPTSLTPSTSAERVRMNTASDMLADALAWNDASATQEPAGFPKLELLQPQRDLLSDGERIRLLQLETEALLLRESMAAFEDEQVRLRQRVQDAEAFAMTAEQTLREAREEVERLRDMVYARDAALDALREKMLLGLAVGLLIILMLIAGFVLWWRSELPDRRLREEARARVQWRNEQEQRISTESSSASEARSTAQTELPSVDVAAQPNIDTPTNAVRADPFLLDMVRAHLDLGDVAAADAMLQTLEQTAAADPQVMALRATIAAAGTAKG